MSLLVLKVILALLVTWIIFAPPGGVHALKCWDCFDPPPSGNCKSGGAGESKDCPNDQACSWSAQKDNPNEVMFRECRAPENPPTLTCRDEEPYVACYCNHTDDCNRNTDSTIEPSAASHCDLRGIALTLTLAWAMHLHSPTLTTA